MREDQSFEMAHAERAAASPREAPFAYAVVFSNGWTDGDLAGVRPTLREAVEMWDDPHRYPEITAYWRDGRSHLVPREAYQRPEVPTRDEALAFIRDRAAKIAASPDPATTFYRAMGCVRCNCDDPEEKQVADYIASARWVLGGIDDDWWHSLPAPKAPDERSEEANTNDTKSSPERA